MINNPELLFWLIEKDTLEKLKTKDVYLKEISELLKSARDVKKQEYLLRYFRKREYLRIATREIINVCDFVEILEELSNLADALIESAVDIAISKLKLNSEYKKGFCVIGLGKLGNRELNFSSDIDLLFVHKEKKKSEIYNKLAAHIVSILSANKEGGFVYRVDVRLRPGGNAYPLSMSIDQYENYYETFGQPWERLSLVKARFSAGDEKVAKEFKERIEPFVYRKSIDIEYIDQIRSLLFKIKKYTQTPVESIIDPAKIDVKKGRGGIREIEFILNYFQLIFGAKFDRLKHISTVDGLVLLKSLGFLEEGEKLKDIYLFLRRIEHKLQLEDEKQTQKLPTDRKRLKQLAKKMDTTVDDFIEKYENDTEFVHDVFKKIFVLDRGLPVFSEIDDLEGFLFESGVDDVKTTANMIKSGIKKFLAAEIKDETIQGIYDRAFLVAVKLNRFDRVAGFFEKLNPAYIASVFENKKLFEVFIKLLIIDFGEYFLKHPFLLDYFLAPFDISNYSAEERKAAVELDIAIKLMDGSFRHNDLKRYTQIAIDYVRDTVREFDKNSELAVIGYGKLAMGELFKGSDLDIVFLCKKDAFNYISVVQKIIKKLKLLYDVDLRLRPYGEKGMLVVDVDFLKNYFQKEASGWEKQAALKSDIIYSGFDGQIVKNLYGDFIFSNPPKKCEIYSMLKKIIENKGEGFDIKSSIGGLTNIEFLLQALCFENRCAFYPSTNVDLLKKAIGLKLIEKELLDYYFYLSKIANMLRLSGFDLKLDKQKAEFVEQIFSIDSVYERVLGIFEYVERISEEYFVC